MSIHMLFKIIAAFGCCALVSTAYAAGNPTAGKNDFYLCSGCHSVPGYEFMYPEYHIPRLAGQQPDYIVAALKAYKDGSRKYPPTMHANAASLSDKQMTDIAAFVSSFKLQDVGEKPISGDIAAGKKKMQQVGCAACHGAKGQKPTAPNFPRLAGQYQDYLIKALKAYRSKGRVQAIMNGIASGLSDQDITNLAAYFASQQPGLHYVPYNHKK